MTTANANRWDHLTVESAARILVAAGHAAGYAGHLWHELPTKVQLAVTIQFNKRQGAK